MAVTFRAGVGAVILNARGRALAFERKSIAGAWQLPQGRIEENENDVDALWRELRAETGLTEAHLILVGPIPEWLGYELPATARGPKTGRGQVHRWFVLRAHSEHPPVRLDDTGDVEFRSWRWIDLVELAEQAVAFRQPVYRRLGEVVAQLGE
jgi:putative (di)nucleoside polyphosphate hydrolase